MQRLNDQAVSSFTGQRMSILLMMHSANKIASTMADYATRRTARINEAYDRLRSARV